MATTYHRVDGLQAAPMMDETIVYDPASKVFCLLNATASSIWARLDSGCTVDDLVEHLSDAFDVSDPSGLTTDVTDALKRLEELKLVKSNPGN